METVHLHKSQPDLKPRHVKGRYTSSLKRSKSTPKNSINIQLKNLKSYKSLMICTN